MLLWHVVVNAEMLLMFGLVN